MALLERDITELRRTSERIERESKERDGKTDRALWMVGGAVIISVLNAILKNVGLQ